MNAPTSTAVLAPTVKLLIGGQFVESQTTQWRDVVNPATQEVLARVPFATPEEINAAVASGQGSVQDLEEDPHRRPRPHLPEAAAADPRKHEASWPRC